MDVSEGVIPDNIQHREGGRRVIKLKAKLKDKFLSAFSSLFKLKGVRTSCTVGHAACTVVSHPSFLNAQNFTCIQQIILCKSNVLM